jgi:hypothetical protein
MSATLAPPTPPALPAPPPAIEAPREERTERTVGAADAGTAEMHRWLTGLVPPFVLGAVFFALAVGTSHEWLIGPAIVLGPILFMFMTVFLCISSDSNGAPRSPAT